eukprot:TRINITY_DN34366_c0_g1_i1.p3 TRINITY_DN34366_c0_g1~~TRINITY_DN34366_c0_g1_i1.p3  ORF type:complete len:136 (-),score=4.75 TRINITY_DN34366_c0_g1_i1:10-417(-)
MNLQDFLNSNPIDGLTDEVAISDRFKDKDGKLMRFKIRVMNSRELGEYRKKAMKVRKNKDVEVDSTMLTTAMVINHTVEPDFKNADSIKKMGCASPEDYLHKVLLPGEIDDLALKIQELSGFNKDFEDLVKEAKN